VVTMETAALSSTHYEAPENNTRVRLSTCTRSTARARLAHAVTRTHKGVRDPQVAERSTAGLDGHTRALACVDA